MNSTRFQTDKNQNSSGLRSVPSIRVIMLTASSDKRNASVWRPSVCLSHLFLHQYGAQRIVNVIHHGAARDAASVHFRPHIERTDMLVSQ